MGKIPELLSEKNILIVFIILLFLAIGLYVYFNYKSNNVFENFLSTDDLDGTTAMNNAPISITSGMLDVMSEVSGLLGLTSLEVQKDPLPGVCSQETLCSGIREPLLLPLKQDSDISGCGWYFAEDSEKPSFPAFGNKDGPLSPNMQKAAFGGKWYFTDLSGAQLSEDRKRCKRINTCKLADLYPDKCAWCESSGIAVPIDEDSKRNKYPDVDDLHCQGSLTYSPEKCIVPEKLQITKDENGNIEYPEVLPPDVCENEFGKMSRNCLIFLAKAAGHQPEGMLIKILNKDPEGYTVTATENNKKLVKVLDDLKHGGSLAWDMEYFGAGACKRKDVIRYYVELQYLVMNGLTEKVRNGAAWLSNGSYYDFDKCTSEMLGPYEITFIQRIFRKAGGTASGTAYPKEENIEYYNGKKCTDLASLFSKLCQEEIHSDDPEKQIAATRKCLGIDIVTPISGCIRRPKFPLNKSCDIITASGSVLIGDVIADPYDGVEVFWYSWDVDWTLPQRQAPLSTFLGREIRIGLPSIAKSDPNFCPFSGFNVPNLVMVIRANIKESGVVRTSMFRVTGNNGIAISVDNKVIMSNWADNPSVSGTSNNFTLNPIVPFYTQIHWYGTANPSLAIQLQTEDNKMKEIPSEQCSTRVRKGFPIVRFDFYNGVVTDSNNVLAVTYNNSDVVFGDFQRKKCLLFNGPNAWVKSANKIAGGAFFSFTTMLFVSGYGGEYNQNRFFSIRQGGATGDLSINLSRSVAIEGCINGNDGTVSITLKSSSKDDPNGKNLLTVVSPRNAIQLNTWTHISAVFTSCMTNCKLYINGLKIEESKNNNITKGYYSGRIYDYAAIGHGYSEWKDVKSPLPFNGGIAWMRFFDYPLSDNDVMTDKNNKFVDPNIYPGGQDSGWNVPHPINGTGSAASLGGPTIPGCPAQNIPAVTIPNPFDFSQPTQPVGTPEVFGVSGYNTLSWNAGSKCSNYNGAKLATTAQLTTAQAAGADWCSSGWVSDNIEAIYPINVQTGIGCGNGSTGIKSYTPETSMAGVNCYGIKPKEGQFAEILPWTMGVWSQKTYVKPAPPPPPPPPPPVWDVSTNRIAGYVDIISGNYSLSFDMTINKPPPGKWGNIIHVNNGTGDCCAFGSRSPAIWLWPDSTRLHIRLGDATDGNWGLDTEELPIGEKIRFSLVTSGNQVSVQTNSKAYNVVQPSTRPTGKGFKIYMNNLALQPAYMGAPVKIENLKYIVDGKEINVQVSGDAPEPPQEIGPMKSGCENGSAMLTCSKGTMTGVRFKYGRWKPDVCPGPNSSTSVKQFNEQIVRPANCIGQSTCNFTGDNNVNGDPWGGTVKHWEATPICS